MEGSQRIVNIYIKDYYKYSYRHVPNVYTKGMTHNTIYKVCNVYNMH